jgi:hypothetical protein
MRLSVADPPPHSTASPDLPTPEKTLKKCEMEAHFLVIILSRLNSSGDRQQYPRIARSLFNPIK